MKVKIALCLTLTGLLFAALAGAVTPYQSGSVGKQVVPARNPGVMAVSPPDRYGYVWQDTIIPGRFIWPDTTTWTRVTGLGDDNFAGPFPIGFQFPYYWYKVSTFFVGSNGYINFGRGGLNAANFDTIPDPHHVNDLVAIYECDMDFTGVPRAQCWYKTNAAQDSLIVAFLHLPFWGESENNNFEAILSKGDSTITFVYDSITTAVASGGRAVGIENITGTIGRSYRDSSQIVNYRVIKFIPPATTTYQALDAGPLDAMNTGSHGFFKMTTDTLTLWATMKNLGNVAITSSYNVRFRAIDSTGAVVRETTALAPPSVPGHVDTVRFGRWVPPHSGNYILRFQNMMTDSIRQNDTLDVEFFSVAEPPLLRFDRQTTSATSWNGTLGGFANMFIPPEYPVKVDTIFVYVTTSTGNHYFTALYDASGPGGSPGALLAKTDTMLAPTTAGWIALDQTTKNVTISSGAFYAAWHQYETNHPALGMDSLPPISRNTWEYTGVWAPSRATNQDAQIRVKTHKVISGVESSGAPLLSGGEVRLSSIRPNPSSGSAAVTFQLPREGKARLAVYDVRGVLVRVLTDGTVPAGEHRAQWDGCDVLGHPAATGVYFFRLEALGTSRTQKALLVR